MLGANANAADSAGTSMLYAGEQFDTSLQMYYNRARQYDPVLARFTSRDPVQGGFKEPMTLHVYLYCQNDWINRTDPTGELWGALRYAYRVVRGIEAYYTALDVGLQMATSPWDVMDVAIAANTFREAYFDPANLNKPFAWELALQGGLGNLTDMIANKCDWGSLVRCAGERIVSGLKKDVPLIVLGELSCYACAGDPEPFSKTAFCAGCFIYRKSSTVRYAALGVDIVDCLHLHCNW